MWNFPRTSGRLVGPGDNGNNVTAVSERLVYLKVNTQEIIPKVKMIIVLKEQFMGSKVRSALSIPSHERIIPGIKIFHYLWRRADFGSCAPRPSGSRLSIGFLQLNAAAA